MYPSALILGSIGVLAETTDLQRRAFNTAFEEHELYWHWDEAAYRTLLEVPGCLPRIRYYASVQGAEVDVDAIYRSKVNAFARALANGVPARPGVAALATAARDKGIKVALAACTDAEHTEIVFDGLKAEMSAADFDFIGDRAMVSDVKPAPEIYARALQHLNVAPEHALAIEDMPESCEAALAAGVQTCAFPGQIAVGRRFPTDAPVIDNVAPTLLDRLCQPA